MVEFSQEVFDTICERIADGESLRAICADADMPSQVSVFKWIGNNDDLAKQYARARESQADALFDEILLIADTPLVGEKRKVKEDGSIEVMEGDMIEHRRLQVDARKWMAGKLRPKVYGDRVAIGGAADMDPIKTEDVGGSAKLEAFLNAVAGRADSGATE